jgi:hypothetical protein
VRVPGRTTPGACRSRVGAAGAVRSAPSVLAALLLLLCVAGCRNGNTAGDAADNGAGEGLETTVTRGPVTVTVSTDRKALSIADRLTLTLTADYDEGYEVEFPRFGEKLEQFGIVDYSTSQPTLSPGGRIHASRTYVLEPFLSGEYVIPSMTFTFHNVESEEPAAHSVETEPLTVQVASLLPEDREKLDIEPIEPPVQIPAEPLPRGWIAAACALVLCLAAGLVLFMRRRRASAPPPPPPPAHETAYAALRALVAEDLVSQGRIKAFYQRISLILRQYIEDRFSLHAPERTTEEFLAELSSGDALVQAHRDLLKAFLVHCDLVKFAEHDPSPDEIQKTFDACSSFIDRTRIGAQPEERRAEA